MSNDNRKLNDRGTFFRALPKPGGFLLLAIAFLLGLVSLGRGQFGDEAETLVVASLVAKGFVLYRDVFTHHFPFPYYWTALIIALIGKSLFILRLSVLIFQTTVFATGMYLTREKRMLGVAAIIWSFLRTFYKGNMVLYNSFAAPSVMLVFVVVLAILRKSISPTWKHYLAIGLFATIAVLSDPVCAYAVCAAFIFLLIHKPINGLKTMAVFGAGLSLFGLYLVGSGSIGDFWDFAVLFNSRIYARYREVDSLRFSEWLRMSVNGLGITDSAWLRFNPFKSIGQNPRIFDRWVFSGFLYRLSIITAAALFVVRKQFRIALFVYLFMAATLVLDKGGFRAQPFIISSLVVVSALITQAWWQDRCPKWVRIFSWSAGVLILTASGWLCIRVGLALNEFRHTYGMSQFAIYETEMATIEAFACQHDNVLYAHYPFGVYSNWFTEMNPVSRFIYLLPWVAEVAQDEVIEALQKKDISALVVIHHMVVWNRYDTEVYLSKLIEFLRENYHQVSSEIYISPELHRRCIENEGLSDQVVAQ